MIHHVFANKSNVGDWLSARAIQFLLGPSVVTEHLCDEPFVVETLGRLALASPRDFIVIGGGGLFMDYFAPFWSGFAEIAHRVPFCIWGVGYCDMKRECSRPPPDLLARIVQQSRLCYVRDELTRQNLPGVPLPPPVPCPTVALIHERAAGFGLLHVDALDNVGEAIYDEMNKVGQAFCAETGRTFGTINNLIPAGEDSALQSVLERYAAADLILTGRLHGCIIGLAMGRKILAISGDNKVESFMQAAGLGGWVLDLSGIASLHDRLRLLPAQVAPEDFLASARSQNCVVADQVMAQMFSAAFSSQT